MTYEERGGQEEPLPSSLHHDQPGATAPGGGRVFLALIGGEMPPRGPQGSVGSRVGAVQRFLPQKPEPHQHGLPGPTSGPAGRHSRGHRGWRQGRPEAPELDILNVSGPL